MLGLPASAGAPALAATGGRAVAQLLPPWSVMIPIEDLTDVTLAIENTDEDDEDDEEDLLTDVSLVSDDTY